MFPLNRPARIAVFASGRGSNLDALMQAFPAGHTLAEVVLVMSDVEDAPAVKKASSQGITTCHHPFPPRKRDVGGQGRVLFEAAATECLEHHHIDLICLAGFMRLLSPQFNARWRGRILNIHPSLLPAFPGLHPQRQALAAGVSESGCTVHFVDAGVDSGPTVLQRRVPVLPDDTEEALSARILTEEHHAYPEAIRRVLQGEVVFEEVSA